MASGAARTFVAQAMRLAPGPLLLLVASIAHAEGRPAAAFESDAALRSWLVDFKKAVAADDHAAVAAMIEPPLLVHVRPTETWRVTDARELATKWPLIFGERHKLVVAQQDVTTVTVNAEGARIGRGELWLKPSRKRHARFVVRLIINMATGT